MFGKKELQQIIESQLIKKTLKLIEVTDSEDEKDNNELFIFGLLALNEECYLETHTYNSIVKSKHWYNDILPAYDNIRFKKILRILPENFKLLVNLIKNHSVFQSNNSKQQLFVELQFAVFIRRLGSRNDIFSICSNFRIAEGTPNSQVRKFVHEEFKTIGGIEDIIGSIDGSHFILQNASTKDKEVYFTRKKRYALHCQGIIDHRDIFLDYNV
ncbi:14025_t:CDS:2, partial [Rhizophagus irregularis]